MTLYKMAPVTFGANHLRSTAVLVAVLLLLSVGLSSTVRAGVVNLAVGPVALAAGYLFARHSDAGYVEASAFAFGAALLAGLVLALFVCAVRVPGWAASAGVSAVIVTLVASRHTAEIRFLDPPGKFGAIWLSGAVALSVIGGLLCLAPGIRRGFSRYRIDGDPAGRPGGGPALLAALTLIGSCLLAALSGILLALHLGAGVPTDGMQYTFQALGAVLIGGVSAFGRRGGIFGTTLGALVVVLGVQILGLKTVSNGALLVAAATVLVGLLVTRVVERFGRPRRVPALVGDPAAPDWPPSVSPAGAPGGPEGGAGSPALDDTWPGGSPYAKTDADSWSGPATATLSAPPVPPPPDPDYGPVPGFGSGPGPSGYGTDQTRQLGAGYATPGDPAPAAGGSAYGNDTAYGARPGETSPFRSPFGADREQGPGPDIDPWGTPPRRI
ncbi:ABC transporter permease [Longispora sp. K20-0274]|uniref:ABC transporter permease n=1 Tax=Longispora sp. K20-0274 TaxID=3088255 RepID=UPI00399A625E